MAIYTWTAFPATGSANFETTARASLELWRSNAVLIDTEIENSRGVYGSLGLRLSAIAGGGGLQPDSIGESHLIINNTAADGKVLAYNATAGKMEWVTQGAATDTGEFRMSASDPPAYGQSQIDDDTIKVQSGTKVYHVPSFFKSVAVDASPLSLTTTTANGRYEYTNEGATQSKTLVLPLCASGLCVFITCLAAYTFQIIPNGSGSDVFRYLSDTSSVGQILYTSTVGLSFRLTGTDNAEWIISNLNGPLSYA